MKINEKKKSRKNKKGKFREKVIRRKEKMKNWMKKLSVVVAAMVMVVGLASCGGGGEATVYKAAMEPTFPPFDTTDDEGNLSGFDYDMLNAIGEDQGFTVEWSNIGFDGLIPAVQSGTVDIIASGMWANDERKEVVDFTDTYFDSGLVVAVEKNNNTIKSIDDLTADMKVAAQIGTSSCDLVQKLAEEGKIKEAKIYDKVNDAVMDVKNGTVQALINDKPVTLEYIAQQPDSIKVVGDVLNKEQYGMAVAKGNTELLEKLNTGLANIIEDGTFQELLEKWNLAE